jgi:hypothetical protein
LILALVAGKRRGPEPESRSRLYFKGEEKWSIVMDRTKRLAQAAAMGLAACLLTACGSYYQVTDLEGGGKYYTKDVDDEGNAGAVRFKDERTGSEVTLQNSQVRPISKDRYKDGMTEH